MSDKGLRLRYRAAITGARLFVFACALLVLAACSAPLGIGTASPVQNVDDLGIVIEGVRLSAASRVIDLRFRVVDPEKAAPVMSRATVPYLVHKKTGRRLGVPSPPKVGRLRQTIDTGLPKTGRSYFAIFENSGGIVAPGDEVEAVLAESRIPLIVQ